MDPQTQPPVPNDLALTLHAVVNNYLSTLVSIAECVGSACPPVGGPYQHRLNRLEKRLAFDSSREAVEESSKEVARELKDYSAKAAAYLRCHGVELRHAISGLEEIVRDLGQKQDYYAVRLRQLTAGVKSTASADEGISQALQPQLADLKSCVDGMCHDVHYILDRMREELAGVEQRLQESEITDPATGLTNRREMERRISTAVADGQSPVLIRFDLGESVPDEVARQVGSRIGSQFRYNDVVCRWGPHEFLVLFQGSAEVAEARFTQVIPWITGRYLLDTGEIANLRVRAELVNVADVHLKDAALSPA